MPIVAIFACGFMVFAAIYAHGIMPYQESLEAEKKQTLEWKIDNAQHAINELKTEITLEDEWKVIQARNLYDVLTPKEQEEIKDYNQLTRAEERISRLQIVQRKCPVLFYLIVFIAIIGVGRCFKDNKNSIEEKAE